MPSFFLFYAFIVVSIALLMLGNVKSTIALLFGVTSVYFALDRLGMPTPWSTTYIVAQSIMLALGVVGEQMPAMNTNVYNQAVP